jgi:hypothetical protein
MGVAIGSKGQHVLTERHLTALTVMMGIATLDAKPSIEPIPLHAQQRNLPRGRSVIRERRIRKRFSS